jgi:hypothetical protein
VSLPRSWFKKVVQHRAAAGYGSGGARSLGDPRTCRARIEQGARRVQSARDGAEVVSQTLVFLWPTYEDGTPVAAFGLDDELRLPAEYQPPAPPIIRFDRAEDERGRLHHWEIYL